MSLLTPVLQRTARRPTLRAGHVVAFGLGLVVWFGAVVPVPPRPVVTIARADVRVPSGWVPVLVPIVAWNLLATPGRR